jgi:hypothetical protein
MLRSIKDLEGYTVSGTDGDVGHVKDCYFDDEAWVVRYFVVGTGEWLRSRRVLISPLAIGHPDYESVIYKHYGRASYWSENAKHRPAS